MRCRRIDTVAMPIRLRHPVLYSVGQVREKVMVQDYRDSRKRIGVKTVSLEYSVNIGTVAGQFARQPADCTFLRTEFITYQHADRFHSRIHAAPLRLRDGNKYAQSVKRHDKRTWEADSRLFYT